MLTRSIALPGFSLRTGFSFLLSLLLLCFAPLSFAKKIEEVRTVEGITEYRLSNGLQVLLFPDPSKDTITVNVTYRVGSKHENYGETGMAHLLEHLLFKGSKNHADITKELTERGAQANGTTWLERTNYYETFKATEDNLKWALGLEADRMVNAFVSGEDLESEMTVVRNEFERGENSPMRVLLQRVYSTALDWHNYGNSTIGARSDIENVNIERLQAFYKKYYQPDNATLIVAGKFDRDLALKTIAKTFGKIKKPKRTLPAFYTREPVQDGERVVNLRRVGGEKVLSAAYRIPAGAHPDFAALRILALVLGDTPSGRLHKALVETQIATGIWAWPNQQREPSLLYFNVSADLEGDLGKAEMALLETVENTAVSPITGEEIERARRSLLKNIELAFNNSQRISINLSEWIGIGDWRLYFIHRDALEKVTLADVQRVANNYLIRSNRTLGRFIPTDDPLRAEITEAPEVASLVDGYSGRAPVKAGEVFDATYPNIAKREQRKSEAGISVSTVPISTRGESVFLQMRMGFGNEEALKNKHYVRSMAVSMLSRGAERFTREQIQDEIDKLKASGGISSDSQGVYARFETTRENLPALVKFIHEIITTANFPEKEFDLLKSQTLSDLKADSKEPNPLALAKIRELLNTYEDGHMFAARSIEENLQGYEAVTLDQVKGFYQEFLGGNDMQFAMVGDGDSDMLTQLVIDQYKNWNNQVEYKEAFSKHSVVEAKHETIHTPDKKNSIFLAAKNIDLVKSNPDTQALAVATRILGGGLISSRLATRIRQQDGLSYGVGANLRVDRRHRNGSWSAYAISAPENSDNVRAAFFEEMQRAYDDGFTQKELEDAVKGMLDEAKVGRSNNGRLVGRVLDVLQAGDDLLGEQIYIDRIRSLSLEEVNQAVKKYLDPKTLTTVAAGDFKK